MKISIIIPTRERALYLASSLQTALAVPDPDVEIIVSDNASTDDTQAVLDRFDDTRLIRLNTGRRVSMRQNFQHALSHATGDYILYIGDDDAVLPGQFAALRLILEKHSPDSLSWPRLSYTWPDKSDARRPGRVSYEWRKFFGAVSAVDVELLRRRLLNAELVWDDTFPALYHGVVARSCLDRLTKDGQDFFMGKSPDIYFSYLALIARVRHMHCDQAFSLHGCSPASTGAASMRQTSSTSTETPVTRFMREAASDPVQQPVAIGPGMPAALFETLEAALQIHATAKPDINYPAWYSYITRKSGYLSNDIQAELFGGLMTHAEAHGLSRALHAAQAEANIKAQPNNFDRLSSGRIAARWNKFLAKVRGLRFSVDNNHISAEAAFGADKVLGGSYFDVLNGNKDRSAAWQAAKQRSKTL